MYDLPNPHLKTGLQSKIFYYLAPVIFSDKPAITIQLSVNEHQCAQFRDGQMKELLELYNIRYFEFRTNSEHGLMLLYQPDRLIQTLIKKENRLFLASFGYSPNCNLIKDLQFLKSRLCAPFPHEIGLFLGIPVQDVIGFMINHGKNYLFSGYWKVYSEPESAKLKFKEFSQAKEIALNLITKFVIK